MNWLIAHLIGDYILQNDWMALNKKRSTLHCSVHVALYSLTVWAMTGLPIWAMAIVAVTHFVQDRTEIVRWWMNSVGQKSFAENLGPWSVIIVDNVWHLIVLFALSEVLK